MSPPIKDFTDLEVYQIADRLTKRIYTASSTFPTEEKYAMTSQIRRAVLSIGANIAESYGRYHHKDKVNFLYHSRGSLMEVLHFMRVARKLDYLNEEELRETRRLHKDLSVKLNNYIQSLKN